MPSKPHRPLATVLVVDDEDSVRLLIRRALQQKGYAVLEAENGEAACRLFAEHAERVRLLLTDVVMPRMSGQKLAEQLRQQDAGLQVVYMSGYTDDPVLADLLARDEAILLHKPFTLQALVSAVRRMLDQAKT